MADKKITLKVLNQAGEEVSTVSVSAHVFGEKEATQAIHDAVVVYQANMRQDTAKTKKRDEVSGGGKKPWRQKGTGRARAGSTRSPIWVGGGTVFGPTGEQNHKIKQNRKEHNLALRSAWSSMVKDLIVVDKLEVEPKTKALVKVLKDLKATGKVLVVLSEENENLFRAGSNIANVVLTGVDNVSVFDLLYFDKIVLDKATLKVVEENLEEAK
ncbi:MAG: 50S ribosomal protein L4 [Bacilli bacterium]|jgi:large subunit ribosomal protein L4|nr:50S ribosomal protein L4 [Bacilli bacterium]